MANQDAPPPAPSRTFRLTTALMAAAVFCLIVGFAMMLSLWWRSGISDAGEILRIASQQYVNGQPIVAGDLASTVEVPDEAEADQSATAGRRWVRPADQADAAEQARQQWIERKRLRDFLIGAGNIARAGVETDARARRKLLLEAVPYLQNSAESGFPPGRQTEGQRILGEALFELGHYDEATARLRQAVEADPTLSRSLAPKLAAAELYASGFPAETSLETVRRYLQHASLTPRQRWAAQQIEVRALIATRNWAAASETVELARQQAESLHEDDPIFKDGKRRFLDQLSLLSALNAVGRAMDRHGGRASGLRRRQSWISPELAQAIRQLEDLEREAAAPISAEARLWSARAHLTIGRSEEALALLTAVRQQRPLGPQAIIAGLEEIELLAQQRRGEEVLQTTRYLMRELQDRQGFQAAEVSFDEFRRRIVDAIQELRRQNAFEHAIDSARALAGVFDPSEALIQEAVGFRQWAAETKTDNTNLSSNAARGAARLARSRYRAAGDAYAAAAELLFDTDEYLSTQWSAIEAYQNGRHFSRSIVLLKPYLRYEQRRRQPRGLVALGRALLAEGDTAEAIQALTTWIDEFPRDPLRYDARLLAAMAYSEDRDFDTARRLLIDNLQDGDLTPQSPAWRDSLFTLAELLYNRGYRNYLEAEQAKPPERLVLLRDNQPTLEEAVRYLDQAVQRYKWIPRAESAAYMSARAHILASRWPRLESQSPEILEAARRSLQTRADGQLQVALEGFTQLRDHLLDREDERGLPEREQRMLRNCYVAQADVLREMGRLPEAVAAYQAAELRYMNEPTALEAIFGRASCFRRMDRQREADLLIRQANVLLARIPRDWDGRFAEVTRYDRAGWEQLLAWMNGRLGDGA